MAATRADLIDRGLPPNLRVENLDRSDVPGGLWNCRACRRLWKADGKRVRPSAGRSALPRRAPTAALEKLPASGGVAAGFPQFHSPDDDERSIGRGHGWRSPPFPPQLGGKGAVLGRRELPTGSFSNLLPRKICPRREANPHHFSHLRRSCPEATHRFCGRGIDR